MTPPPHDRDAEEIADVAAGEPDTASRPHFADIGAYPHHPVEEGRDTIDLREQPANRRRR